MPKGLFNFGGGGVNAFGSLCGVPLGAAALLAQLGAPQNVKNRLMHWYETTAMPSNACYEDYASGLWTPGGTSGGVWGGATGLTIPTNNVPMSRSDSVLCHVSLTKWRAAAEGYMAKTRVDGTSDRCGKLCYDMGVFLVGLLNDWKAGVVIDGTVAPSATVAGCKNPSCHGGPVVDENCPTTAQGIMDCKPCHTGL